MQPNFLTIGTRVKHILKMPQPVEEIPVGQGKLYLNQNIIFAMIYMI